MTKPIVVLHFDESGMLRVLTSGDVTVLSVDDSAPADRIYEHRATDDRAAIEELLRGEVIGHDADEKQGEAARRLGIVN